MNTDDVYHAHLRRTQRERRKRDAEATLLISVAEFARQRGLNAWSLRRRLRIAGYDRKGNHKIPMKDLERFVKE